MMASEMMAIKKNLFPLFSGVKGRKKLFYIQLAFAAHLQTF
jgi:hypothetical protein